MSSSMGRIIPYMKWKKTNLWNHQLEYHWTLWVMGFQWFIMWWYLMVHLVFVTGIISHLVWWCYVQWFSHGSIYVGCTTMFTKGYVETSWKCWWLARFLAGWSTWGSLKMAKSQNWRIIMINGIINNMDHYGIISLSWDINHQYLSSLWWYWWIPY